MNSTRNFALNRGDVANTTSGYSILQQYNCPSDSAPELTTRWRECSYVGNWGTLIQEQNECQAPPIPTRGPLWPSSRVRIRDIRDGTSNTIAVGEQRHDTFGGDPCWAWGQYGTNMSGTSHPLNFAPTTLQTPPDVAVSPVDLAATLEQLSFRVSSGATGNS